MKVNILIKQKETDKTDYLQIITDKLSKIHNKIGQEQTESRFDIIMMDIAQELNGFLEINVNNNEYIFDFTQ